MPTYRNDKTKVLTLRNLAWEKTAVSPGESIESYEYLYLDGLTKTAETPLFNRICANSSITLTESAVDYLLHPDTTQILVSDITGAATVTTGDDYPGQIPIASGESTVRLMIDRPRVFFEKLRLSGSGTCTVMEFRPWPWETVPDGN